MPYSGSTVFTEYWDVHVQDNGDRYLVVTNTVEDPVYLQLPWITAIHFRKEGRCRQVGPDALRREVLTDGGGTSDRGETAHCEETPDEGKKTGERNSRRAHAANRPPHRSPPRHTRVATCCRPSHAFSWPQAPAWAQVQLTGTYEDRLYEDYIERGPGSDLGDFTGMPMTDEARAKALSYTSNMPMTLERQCLSQDALGRALPTPALPDLEHQ